MSTAKAADPGRRRLRPLLRTIAVIVAAVIVAGVGIAGFFFGASRTHGPDQVVPFFGTHQAGVATTPQQSFAFFASFDVTTTDRSTLRSLLERWSSAASLMTAGKAVGGGSEANTLLPPSDIGQARGLGPSRLTITFGAGPSLFDGRFGLAAERPQALVDLPGFTGDQLRPQWTGGDLGVLICADDKQVAFDALENLTRTANGAATLRWFQDGFRPTAKANSGGGTERNLMGFKDGTVNPDAGSVPDMDKSVWVGSADGPAWMVGGTYLVVRKIRMYLDVWNRSSLQDQEQTFGRDKGSGAPIGETNEFAPLDLTAKSAGGKPEIPEDAHVRLAHGSGANVILRRSYSYVSGLDERTGEIDAGLLFIALQRDPRTGFIPIQERLASSDALNEYITHVGSGIFAMFPGARPGGYVGESLFDAVSQNH